MNTWGIKKLILAVLVIQVAMLGTVGLAALGFDVPGFRQSVGFVYLTFLPGLLILRLFRLPRLQAIEALLYSVGLSIAFVMFLGFFINISYPVLGISKPISIFPVMATIAFVLFILCLIAYKWESSEKECALPNSVTQWSSLLSPPVLFLFLLPVLGAVGAFLVYFHYSNVPLLILLSLIALTAVLVALGKFIPTKLYPLAIAAISIALLWHVSLLTFYLRGSDMYREYLTLELVLSNAIWDPSIGTNLNAMLSITMLTPLYSLVLGLDTVWVVKLIFPLFFGLVPVTLFQAYRRQTNEKVAFLAAFFFMSMPVFFTLMPGVRQPIAEVFLALCILLFSDTEIDAAKRAALLIIFGLSIVVSHYGTAYIYMFYLLVALPLLALLRSSNFHVAGRRTAKKLGRFRPTLGMTYSPKSANRPLSRGTLTANYVALFTVFCLAWYMYVSSGSPFTTIVRIGDHIYTSLSTEFLALRGSEIDVHIMQALGLAPLRSMEVEWRIARVFQYITQLFIVVGVAHLILRYRKTRFYPEYRVLTLISLVIIGFSIVLPYFAKAISMMRLYHVTLFFLAPFCILGGSLVFFWLAKLFSPRSPHCIPKSMYIKVVTIGVVVPYFLFTTGFIFELTGATPTSSPLSFYEADWPLFTRSEMQASIWLAKVMADRKVYCDLFTTELLIYGKGSEFRTGKLESDPEEVDDGSYVFLRRWNVIHDEALVSMAMGKPLIHRELQEIELLNSPGLAKIYDNDEAQVLWYSKREVARP